MKILVTGTEGYLGSLLPSILIQRGHEVIGVDTGFYKVGWLYNGTEITAKTLNKDIRQLTLKDLQGVEAVVHMAELSNDPTGQLSPHITYDINHKGSISLAKLALSSGVRRFVYMSSCSVYGVATKSDINEESPVNPQTVYAECKTLVEKDVKLMANDSFSPTFLRNATAFGASPRMRFDIVLNNLAGLAWTTKEIKMTSDGTPWRPLVHALDICKAIVCTLEAPRDIVHNQIFNVGDTTNNYRVKEVAEIIADVFKGCKLSFGDNGADNRSYRVSFEKINQILPGFKCEWTALSGAKQLFDLFTQIDMSEEIFMFRGFTRLKQLEYLIRTQQIDKDFFLEAVMLFTETKLKSAFIIELEQRTDSRGFFARTFCAKEFEAHGLKPIVAQCNLSFNYKRGTLRGMHYQIPPATETKLIRCTQGAIYDVIIDMRPDSPTYLLHIGVELTAENRKALYVPEMFAHGYQALTDETEVMYQVGEFYTPGYERGLRYNDPALGVEWPLAVSEISEKDMAWSLFESATVGMHS